MRDEMETGLSVASCRSCGTQVSFRMDDRWEPKGDGFRQIFTKLGSPAHCMMCGGTEIELHRETINTWVYFLQLAAWNVSQQTVDLARQLYDVWSDSGRPGTFVEYLIDFKASVQAKRASQS